jgi:hypothetical protein
MRYVCVLRQQVLRHVTVTIDAENEDEAYEQAEAHMLTEKHTLDWDEDGDNSDDDAYEVVRVEAEQ